MSQQVIIGKHCTGPDYQVFYKIDKAMQDIGPNRPGGEDKSLRSKQCRRELNQVAGLIDNHYPVDFRLDNRPAILNIRLLIKKILNRASFDQRDITMLKRYNLKLQEKYHGLTKVGRPKIRKEIQE